MEQERKGLMRCGGYGETHRRPRVRRGAEWLAGRVKSQRTVKEERNFSDTTAQYLDVILMDLDFCMQDQSYRRSHPTAVLEGAEVRSNPWSLLSRNCVKFSLLCQFLALFCQAVRLMSRRRAGRWRAGPAGVRGTGLAGGHEGQHSGVHLGVEDRPRSRTVRSSQVGGQHEDAQQIRDVRVVGPRRCEQAG
jgi:hypothetical protein